MSDDIGPMIRTARERRGWSQEFLAAKVGATQSTIDRIESGLTRRSRVLPEIVSALDIDLPGHEKRQTPTQVVGGFARVTYVLPKELIERIEQYKFAIGISSDDEAVRRIIDDFLKKRDEIVDVINRIINKYKLIKSMREAAGTVLANHPLVTTISFDKGGVVFDFDDSLYGKLDIEITSWGLVSIKKPDGSNFFFHKSDAPAGYLVII
ncbi:hypothetical protein GCM10025880_27290 [Methylorubrum aminovorans]|uniref:helix-turn-helix domain-containing protein n=1 Tax=Methylorubrum aminovorans TaxID=269069 RepID=UPI0023E9A4A1|nr:helix-turn-helix transcriptional regulator [Methylorubrum aminovorans]GMA76312.1 hypothetical protein GCM10025880_27290 [Methylorubrum aminovorans]